jgi:hypothetical protein
MPMNRQIFVAFWFGMQAESCRVGSPQSGSMKPRPRNIGISSRHSSTSVVGVGVGGGVGYMVVAFAHVGAGVRLRTGAALNGVGAGAYPA